MDIVEIIKSEHMPELDVVLVPDQDPQNPRREYDQAGVMLAWHGRYDLGDDAKKIEEATGMHKPSPQEFQEWARTAPEMKGALIIPLFVYEHGGITMRAGTGFSCPWDSGQVGWIYFTRAEMLKEWGSSKTRVTKKTRDAARAYAMAAVGEYADYLEGNVYGYIVREREEEDGDAEDGDSCWGFIGFKYAKEEARRALAYAIKARRKKTRDAAAADKEAPRFMAL